MSIIWFFLYNIFIVPLLFCGFKIRGLTNSKIREGVLGRVGQFAYIKEVIAQLDKNRKKILFHCVSVGEWLQAIPIIDQIKNNNPDIFIIVSFFSPSGFNYAKKHPNVDLKIYLPFDTYKNAKKFFNTIQPDLWIISKFDVWPNHLYAAKILKIPTVLTDATLSANSKRYKGIVGAFNRYFYQSFDCIFPISEDDKKRFLNIYPNSKNLIVTGDTRFDQVANSGELAKQKDKIPLYADDSGIKFIAGSIWPADEKHLLPALINIIKKYPHLKAILVPHELHESHIKSIENILKSSSLTSERYSVFSRNGLSKSRITIIDTIGILARLYAQSDIAYVGGAFDAGLHNVMEPALFELPVLFGPHCSNSFEALQLYKIGGGFKIHNAFEIQKHLELLICDKNLRKMAGKKAKNYIYQNLGATNNIITELGKRFDFIS